MTRGRGVLLVLAVLAVALGAWLAVRSTDEAGARLERPEAAERPTPSATPLVGAAADPGEERVAGTEGGAEEVETDPERTPAAEPAAVPVATASPTPGADDERLVFVALRTPEGAPFLKAVETGLFMPRAVATRESPDEKPPPPEGPRGCSEGVTGRKFPGHGPDEGVIRVLRLSCEPPLWVSLMFGEDVLASQVLQPEQDEVVFVMDPREFAARQCTLRFRAVDASTGEPLTGAGANVFCRGLMSSYQPVSGASFVIERLYPGPVSVRVNGEGHAGAQRDVELEPGSEVDLGDVPLESLVRHPLRVTVRRPAGARGVVLHCEPAQLLTEPMGPRALGVWHKDVDGDDVRIQLAPDRWAIWAEGADDDGLLRSATVVVKIEAGLTEAALELVRPVRVTLRNGPEHAAALPRTLDGLWAREPAYLAPDTDGVLELVPGTYELVVRAEGKDERVLPLQVGAQAIEVDLR